MTEQQYLYRVVGSCMPFYYEKFPILKTTEKGHWIVGYYGKNKFVKTGTRKCFAHQTLEGAYESFKYRKEFEARILKTRLDHVKEVLEQIEQIKITDVSEIPDDSLIFS